jgi:hypothetical protein
MSRELAIANQSGMGLTHDPLTRITGTSAGHYVSDGYGLDDIVDDVLFGSVNLLLGAIDSVTGLNLLGFAEMLQGFFGPGSLLSSLFGWLTPGTGTAGGGIFGPLLGIGGGNFGDLGGVLAFLNPFNLISVAASSFFSLLPISHLGKPTVNPNLVLAPGFDKPENVHLAPGWVYDATAGQLQGGSIKTDPDYVGQREMLSNEIPVAPEDSFNLTAFVKWQSLTYTGAAPVSFGIAEYKNKVRVANVIIATRAPTSGNTQPIWQELTGTYDVPDDDTVDEIRVRLYTPGTVALGSSVWWDDIEARKTGDIKQGWVQGLPQALQDIAAVFEQIIDGIGNVFRIVPIFGSAIADLIDELTDFFLGTEDTAAVAADASQGLTVTRESVVTNITGLAAEAPPDAQVDGAIAGQTEVISYLTMKVADLEHQLTPAPSVSDPINYSGPPDPALWDVQYYDGFPDTGDIVANGVEFHWSPEGSNARGALLRYIGPDAVAPNDRFSSKVIVGEQGLPINSTSSSYIDAYVRMNTAKTRFVRARMARDLIRVSCFVDGTETVFGTQGIPNPPGVGAQFEIIPKLGDDRIFLVTLNTNSWEFEDTGDVHFFGADYRHRGCGLYAGVTNFGFTFIQSTAASIGHWYSEAP